MLSSTLPECSLSHPSLVLCSLTLSLVRLSCIGAIHHWCPGLVSPLRHVVWEQGPAGGRGYVAPWLWQWELESEALV